MSKFIRTKDGIFEAWENGETCNGFGCKFNYGTIKIHKKDILKQADTIEELCDLFYLDRGGDIDINEFYDNYQFDVVKENYLEEVKHFNPVELKAYINTDKGLIYVAKLNDKGELELI